jgi:hypothetical protein
VAGYLDPAARSVRPDRPRGIETLATANENSRSLACIRKAAERSGAQIEQRCAKRRAMPDLTSCARIRPVMGARMQVGIHDSRASKSPP